MSFTSFTFHKLKKKVAAVVGRTADWALFLGIVLIGGVGSSWYMVDAGSSLTTTTIGSWTTWPSAARSDADPYTRAHYARLGLLPGGRLLDDPLAQFGGDGLGGLRLAQATDLPRSLACFDRPGSSSR